MALVALLVSGTAFMINGGLFLRGSEIAAVQPDHFILYRDAGPHDANLWLAVPVSVINAASGDYGDVVVYATASLSRGRKALGRFEYSAVVEPVRTQQVEAGVANCPQGARCLPETGFYVIERPPRLLDVPGGASRSDYLAFILSTANCRGAPAYCDRFGNFDGAVAALRADENLQVRVELSFHFDGDTVLTCRVDAGPPQRNAILDYLVEKGWAQPGCVRPPRRDLLHPPGLN